MGGHAEYQEFRPLVVAAAAVLGLDRTALVAGCSSSAVQVWLRRPVAELTRVTIELSWPRLRGWEQWDSGYEAAQTEALVLTTEEDTTMGALAAEFASRFQDADRAGYRLSEIALGCETTIEHMARWAMGHAPDAHRPDLVRAVAHLRHLSSWPPPAPGKTAEREISAARVILGQLCGRTSPAPPDASLPAQRLPVFTQGGGMHPHVHIDVMHDPAHD
jgi:hypothetical protein